MSVPGVIVHNPVVARRWFTAGGAALTAGAGGGAYANHDLNHDDTLGFVGAGVGGAVGLTLVGVGQIAYRKRFMPYMNGKVYSSMDDAIAAARAFKQDVGLHQNKGTTDFGLLDLKKFDVDNEGGASVDLGDQHVRIPAISTRDGDVHRLGPNGEYVNSGVQPNEMIDLSKEKGLTPDLAARLHHAQLGTDDSHEALVVGSRISPDKGFTSKALAERWAFEQAKNPAMNYTSLQTGAKEWHIFNVHGPSPADVSARGRTVTPFERANVVEGMDTYGAKLPGDAYQGRGIEPLKVSSLSDDAARSLTGKRLALNGSDIIRVGKLTDEFDSAKAAETALYERGGEHLIVDHKGKSLVYAIGTRKGTSAIDSSPSVLLAPDSDVRLFRGAYSRGVMGRGLDRIDFREVAKLPVAQAKTLTGERISGYGEPYSKIGKLVDTHSSREAANQAARETERNQIVIPMKGGVARFEVTGPDPRGQEAASLLGPDGAYQMVLERKAYETNGPEWFFAGRSVPFQPDEPLGHDIMGYGGASRITGGPMSWGRAEDDIVNDAWGGRTRYAAIQGNGDEVHTYELGGSGSNGRWDRELGEIKGVAQWHRDTRVEQEVHDSTWPHQNWMSAYVDDLHYGREWVRVDSPNSAWTRRDTGWDLESRSRNWSETNSLQSRRRMEYENWKRQQEEAEKRKNS